MMSDINTPLSVVHIRPMCLPSIQLSGDAGELVSPELLHQELLLELGLVDTNSISFW